MYYQGNLAVKETSRPQTVYRESRKTVKRKKTIPTKEKFLYLFAIVICVVVAGLVILRYAQIYEVNAKLQQIENEIKRLEAENSTMQLQVNMASDPKRLIDKAKMLGLRPSNEQEISEIPQRSELAGLQDVAIAAKR